MVCARGPARRAIRRTIPRAIQRAARIQPDPAMSRDSMEFDVVIVGAGPSGLAAAVRLRQLAIERESELSVCVVEKGSEVGAHVLSGAVLEPRALDELIPDWRERGAPLTTPAAEDRFLLLTGSRAIRLPTPPQMRNRGNYVAPTKFLRKRMRRAETETAGFLFLGGSRAMARSLLTKGMRTAYRVSF